MLPSEAGPGVSYNITIGKDIIPMLCNECPIRDNKTYSKLCQECKPYKAKLEQMIQYQKESLESIYSGILDKMSKI